MNISSLINNFVSKEQMEGIAKEANVSTEGANSVLSAAATMFANKANDGSMTLPILEGLKGSTDAGKLITALLGGNAAREAAKRSGLVESETGSVLKAAAPIVMDALNSASSSDLKSLLSMVKVFADNKKSSGILGFLSSLFGRK